MQKRSTIAVQNRWSFAEASAWTEGLRQARSMTLWLTLLAMAYISFGQVKALQLFLGKPPTRRSPGLASHAGVNHAIPF